MTDANIKVLAPVAPEFAEILTPEALTFVAILHRQIVNKRKYLLQKRVERQQKIDAGVFPNFLPETKAVRDGEWKVKPAPPDLQKRWVEITGPASNAKMVINALNSGANVYMADAEDSESPTWKNILNGQLNLHAAARKTITYTSPEKEYRLNAKTATLMFRPRGWHLVEKHVEIDGEPVSASVFDFGLYFFHNTDKLLENGTGPYFYLPKLENHLETRLWKEVFDRAQYEFNLPKDTIKATVLIETILAAFEMDEILYELQENSAGLNCGRWDYIFSFIKKFRNCPQFVLPDRALVTMDKGFLKSYVDLLIQTCHKRGAYAMGGMAAQIPIKNDPTANEKALEKVVADKLREVRAGHDGTWVAHPGLVPIAQKVFSAWLDTRIVPAKNQLEVLRNDVQITANDLLKIPDGEITEAGLRTNLRVGVQYLDAWLNGNGCVPINNLMEDAATAEISRAQVWQWRRHGKFSGHGINQILQQETRGRSELSKKLFFEMMIAEKFPEFLTLSAYDELLKLESLT